MQYFKNIEYAIFQLHLIFFILTKLNLQYFNYINCIPVKHFNEIQ